ncbi:MAG: lipopolysaccharide heptosyltransferase II [Elusimicrobia bacterium]|jgi:heptosyltransferase-2|nr:lipopolysaccharide heptosyltransferase II [Elusimicrobiota bacterium]MBK7544998.1 lipopolysaccharide heptosyltransferase II [Elusimicrobiota bacterium]MBK7574514.1 lipopolysaccharide heptosyltransferase II [Elusimicrobiota bacterium]MBK8423477.1 lipopolysaccharide heptosyltransferase II [Elusimicrobiota bacterium]MBK8650373.1 lipopolysaccharide heptosyltransferase II [Elusimicrobiota bacterium]
MKILVRAPNWLGDAVMCTPLLRRLAAQGHALDVLCRPSVAGVFQGAPGVDAVWVSPRGESPWATARELKKRRYERAVILPPSFGSALAPCLAGIPERVGWSSDFRRLLLTRAVPVDERFHYVRRYLALIGEEGAEVPSTDLYFPEAPAPGGWAGDLTGRLLAVAPGSRAPARRWDPERFAETINRLPPSWAGAVLLGAPEDAPVAARVESLCRRPVRNLCGKTTLPALAGVLKNCAALLTNESGLMHVGWAVDRPLVVVSGPSNVHATSPFGPHVRVIQHREIPCVPCVKNECLRAPDERNMCLKAVTVREVLDGLASVAF